MRILQSAVRGGVIVCCLMALSYAVPEEPKEQWFGTSEGDFAKIQEFAGCALRVKARFVSDSESLSGLQAQPGKSSRHPLSFCVAAGGGDLTCRMESNAKSAKLLKDLKRGTPIVMHGTIDIRRNCFMVKKIEQGWGNNLMTGRN